jgi:Flp pilus assembly protein TadB
MRGSRRLLVWATLWVAFAIYWLVRGFWILSVALVAAAALLCWQVWRDRQRVRLDLSAYPNADSRDGHL